MPYKDEKKRKEYKKRWNKQYYKNNKRKERKRIANRKHELKSWFKQYKSTLKCTKCGETHRACLEFHHKNMEKKEFDLSESTLRKGYSKERILKEIEKCIVLCANCHRKLHSK